MTEIMTPMLLKDTIELPIGNEWQYEVKLDGWRVLGRNAVQGALLWTRSGNICTDKFETIASQLPDALSRHSAVVDGEVVGLSAENTASFAELRKRRPRAVYYMFDILQLNGESLLDEPLRRRRQELESIFDGQKNIFLSPVFDEGDVLVEAAREHRLEGVVAKRRDSRYQSAPPGERAVRSRDWLKLRFPEYPTGFGRP